MSVEIKCSEDVYKQFEFLKDYEHEELWLLCINANEITGKIMLSKGAKNKTLFDGALFAKEILSHKYTHSVFLVHNHPSGNTQISNEDRNITKMAKEICKLFDYRFLDHVIVCRDEYVSFNDEGEL